LKTIFHIQTELLVRRKNVFRRYRKSVRLSHFTVLMLGDAFLLNSCFLKQDRATVIYGTITDQNHQPVGSILVSIDGVKGFSYETLKEVYSDEDGNL
jgi:hypothetical protein